MLLPPVKSLKPASSDAERVWDEATGESTGTVPMDYSVIVISRPNNYYSPKMIVKS